MMIVQQVRKSGNSLVVTIPREEVERLRLVEGQFVSLEVTPMELKPTLTPEWKEALDRAWPWLRPGLEYLKDR
jgi:antitoxin component of MazEF toxin-antitoxin module